MNANRTKILSTTALIAILLIQMFWMWNTYNINARQLGKECDEILEKTLDRDIDTKMAKYVDMDDTIQTENSYHPEVAFYDYIYRKTHQDANIDTLTNIADSIFKAEVDSLL